MASSSFNLFFIVDIHMLRSLIKSFALSKMISQIFSQLLPAEYRQSAETISSFTRYSWVVGLNMAVLLIKIEITE